MTQTTTAGQPESSPSPSPRADKDTGQRLAIFVFIATLLGSLLGAIADLSDASSMVVPIVKAMDPSPRLNIAGSNTILGEEIGMMEDWRQAFTEQRTWQNKIPIVGSIDRSIELEVQGVGSVRGFERASQAKAHLLAASEPIPAQDQQDLTAAGIDIQCAAEIGYDVIAFVTDVNNIVPEISTRDMASILSGSITDWSQVGGTPQPIRILARRGSGTTEIVLRGFTGSAEFRPHFTACNDNTDCLDLALSTPGSLYWVSTSWLRTQPPRYLRLILIRRGDLPAENPLQAEFDPDKYPLQLIRPLYMYVLGGDKINQESSDLAKDFLYYVRGVQGQEILEARHFYTYFDPPADIQVDLPPDFGLGPDGLPIVCRP